ncbi:hypothetical protein M407DRAFT_31490 [Tulasnella calospora MUT 4182]|uniref:Uncharacterized protein n=1 Tax=Tulasnella calospora MUT 4182 TaxID=1051891 RepID=A0A0C3LBI4_9AGAM|nr:hypothetical protein M407DRAFT_31490 [Tulasnella calospora MUT 4182]
MAHITTRTKHPSPLATRLWVPVDITPHIGRLQCPTHQRQGFTLHHPLGCPPPERSEESSCTRTLLEQELGTNTTGKAGRTQEDWFTTTQKQSRTLLDLHHNHILLMGPIVQMNGLRTRTKGINTPRSTKSVNASRAAHINIMHFRHLTNILTMRILSPSQQIHTPIPSPNSPCLITNLST